MLLRISEVIYEGVCFIKLEGNLQGDTYDHFVRLFSRRVDEGIRYFVIDITEVIYISSAGLVALVTVPTRLSLRVSKYCFVLPVVSSTKEVRAVLDMTGLYSTLQINTSLDGALSEFLGRPVDGAEVVRSLRNV
jgi:anti-anti-sigma factor